MGSTDVEEGMAVHDFSGFVVPMPPLVGGGGAHKLPPGTLPEGMYFIGLGVFMMEVCDYFNAFLPVAQHHPS
jgi:hypothetical protein